MSTTYRWKILAIAGAMAFVAACAPKRNVTQFAKNKEAEAGQTYTEEQLRSALGSDRYDALVQGIGAANLNLLSYGIGISNMAQLINGVTGPGKLVALMSDGPNSRKLTAIEVLDLLNKLDDACQQPGSFGSDTIGKMVNMINQVSLAGMEGVKNVVHGVRDQPADLNGAPYTNGVARLAFLISLLNETLSVMPTLVNDLAAPGGIFSASGNQKLIRLVNQALDIRDLAVIINNTTSLSNITAVMAGLTGNMFCSKPEYQTQASCTGAGGTWTNTLCTNPSFTTRATCTSGGGSWEPDGIENMARIINELDRVCSNTSFTNGKACIDAGHTWHTKAIKIPVIVNNITVVSNMFQIVNGLTSDGKRPPWPTGQPAPYPGDAGNEFDGVDSMVATLNWINVPAMGDPGSANTTPYGTNGVKRLAYMVNQLETVSVVENDSNFDTGTDCANGLFDNRLNWAFSDNGPSGSPWFSRGWRSGAEENYYSAPCSLRNDPTAATASTATQSAELIVNLIASGSMTVRTKTDTLGPYDTFRIFIDDVLQASYTQATGGAGWQLRTIAISTGLHRIRFDVHRALNSTGQVFIDDVILPGTKGAARTAAEKTAIMLNNLYIASSITNVADLLNNTTAPSCIATPLTCTPTNNNGVDALIYSVNRSEYPGNIKSVVTISNSSPAVVTWTAHGLSNGTAIKFLSTGSLPNPLVQNTIYYVRNVTTNTFNLSSTPSGGLINTSTAGSGQHTGVTLPRLAVTVNGISNLNEMYNVLNNLPSEMTFAQLVSMMDYIENPANIPTLINSLGSGGGLRTADILSNITAAGTSNMLRVLADPPAGAPIADTARLINGAATTSHVGTILTELTISGNIFLGKSQNVTFSSAPGTVFVNWSGHGYTEGSEVQFSTTGALPAGMTNGTIYYTKNVSASGFNLSATRYGAAISVTSAGSGTHTAFARGELYYASPTGGVKLAQFFNQVNTLSTTYSQNCTTGNASQFCIKNHLVRLVNDVSTSSLGPATISQIVGNMRGDNGPGTSPVCPSGCTGVQRMTNVLYDLRTMDAGTCIVSGVNQGYVYNAARCTAMGGTWTPPANQYTNPLSNTTADTYGRLTALMADMGANGGLNTARMVNEVSAPYLTSLDGAGYRVSYLVQQINRMRYLSRMLSEMTSADLMLQLLNSANMNVNTIRNLVNGQGNLAYGTNTTATNLGSFYTAANQTGHMPGPSTTYGAGGSGFDTLGRMIQFINSITSGIENVVTLMNVIYDTRYMGATNGVTTPNSMPTPYNPDQAGDRDCYDATPCGVRNYGYGMLNEADRIEYLSNLINGIVNLDLFLTIVNGPGACSNVTYQSRSTCLGAGHTWTEGTMGHCSNLSLTTQAACTSGGGTWTPGSASAPNSAHYLKMIRIVNDVAGSTRKGSGTKAVGDISILSDVINDLGWYAGAPQSLANQARIITITNDVVYCGINPANDRNITTGPNCSIAGYTNQASCVGGGGTWNNIGQVLLCNQPIGYSYSKLNDFYDPRPRVANAMLAMDSAFPMSIIVGQIANTQKTVRVMNGARRINTIIKTVNWMPGEATRDLINYTNLDQIYRAFDYLANNLDPDEDVAATAFTSLIFWGNGIGQGGLRDGTCMYFTGVGPRRMAGVINSESGLYLEGLLQKFGWRTVIPEMICGLSPHGSSYENYSGYGSAPSWINSGTAINANATDNVCRSTPNQDRCMRIPGSISNVDFKQKEVLTTVGQCSNTAYKTRHSCVSNGGTWDNTTGSFTWSFGVRNATDNTSCKTYYPETAGAYGHNPELDDTVFLGVTIWGNSINAGIGGVWDVLKGGGLIGWLLTNGGTINYPPRRRSDGTIGDTGYTCTDGSSGDEWSCTNPGMNDSGNGNVSYYRWGRRCSISRRSGNNCDLNYTMCESTCQGRWIPDKDYNQCRIDPATGVEPIR